MTYERENNFGIMILQSSRRVNFMYDIIGLNIMYHTGIDHTVRQQLLLCTIPQIIIGFHFTRLSKSAEICFQLDSLITHDDVYKNSHQIVNHTINSSLTLVSEEKVYQQKGRVKSLILLEPGTDISLFIRCL